jgi:hypothetical protein
VSDGSELGGSESPGLAAARRVAPGTRSASDIRRDIQLQREELAGAVDSLRGRVTELTDWRRQVREHRRELAIGAAVVGFAIGLRLARRRR